MSEWNPLSFDRQHYLDMAESFEAMSFDEADQEECEYNEDIGDMAVDFAYLRYNVAKLEEQNEQLRAEVERLKQQYTGGLYTPDENFLPSQLIKSTEIDDCYDQLCVKNERLQAVVGKAMVRLSLSSHPNCRDVYNDLKQALKEVDTNE